MKNNLGALLITFLFSFIAQAQTAHPWILKAENINPSEYYGVTVANGMIGLVSSPEPLKVKDVVLAGAYDQYGRGRVSNFLRSFNLLNMYLEIDGRRVSASNTTNFVQELDMQGAKFTGTFNFEDKASVTYTYYSLRHLPFTVLMDVKLTPKKTLISPAARLWKHPMHCAKCRIITTKLTGRMWLSAYLPLPQKAQPESC